MTIFIQYRNTLFFSALLLVTAACSDDSQFSIGANKKKSAPSEATENSGDASAEAQKTPSDSQDEEYSTAVPPLVITGAYLTCKSISKNQSINSSTELPSDMPSGSDGVVGCGVYQSGDVKIKEEVEVVSVSASFESSPDSEVAYQVADSSSPWHFYVIDSVSTGSDHIIALYIELKIAGQDLSLENKPYFASKFHVMFVTSEKFFSGSTEDNGFNSLATADAHCQRLSANTSFPGRTWQALLGDDDTLVYDRIKLNGPIFNIKLEELWAKGDDIFNKLPAFKVQYTDFGVRVDPNRRAWTAAYPNNDAFPGGDIDKKPKNCKNWSSGSAKDKGRAGDPLDISEWLTSRDKDCDNDNRFYCVSDLK